MRVLLHLPNVRCRLPQGSNKSIRLGAPLLATGQAACGIAATPLHKAASVRPIVLTACHTQQPPLNVACVTSDLRQASVAHSRHSVLPVPVGDSNNACWPCGKRGEAAASVRPCLQAAIFRSAHPRCPLQHT